MEKQHFNIIGGNEIEGSFWIMDNDYSDLLVDEDEEESLRITENEQTMDINYSDIFDDYEENDLGIDNEIFAEMAERECIKHENEIRNSQRDKKGRLKKGVKLASKDNCNKVKILLRHDSGMTVKQIVECLECSKSTVYSVIKKHRK